MLGSFATCAPCGRHRDEESTMLDLGDLAPVYGLQGRVAAEQERLCCLVQVLPWSLRV